MHSFDPFSDSNSGYCASFEFFFALRDTSFVCHKQPQKIRKKSKAFTVSEMNRRGVGMAGIIKQKEQAVKIKILVISVLNYSV